MKRAQQHTHQHNHPSNNPNPLNHTTVIVTNPTVPHPNGFFTPSYYHAVIHQHQHQHQQPQQHYHHDSNSHSHP